MKSDSPPSTSSSTNIFLVAVVGVLLAVLGWQWLSGLFGGTVTYTNRTPSERGEFTSEEKSTMAVFKEASPSVVSVRVKMPTRFTGRSQDLSSGSGVVWDDQGHIVTNFHVIERAVMDGNLNLEVQFADGSVADATVVGGVRENDLAVLRVARNVTDLLPIRLGTSDDLQVGQRALAIGSPFGFDQTLSTGTIGGLNRVVASEDGAPLTGLIQTDAAINPGNSGGPLLDSDGRLIGVNTAIISPTGTYAGLGFAVPASAVMESVGRVFSYASGDLPPVIGVVVLSPEGLLGSQLPESLTSQGLFIQYVEPGGPASKLGLRTTQIFQRPGGGIRIELGDQIYGVDGSKVTTLKELQTAIRKHQVGDTITLNVYRDGRLQDLSITLAAPRIIL